jgi:ribosomal protein L16/L10AE
MKKIQTAFHLKYKKRFLLRLQDNVIGSIIQNTIHFKNVQVGDFFFKFSVPKVLDNSLVMILRKTLLKKIFKKVHFWYYFFLTQILTSKPRELRMGKGKGTFLKWIERFSLMKYLFSYTFLLSYSFNILALLFHQLQYKIGHTSWFFFKFLFFKGLKNKIYYFSLNLLMTSIK